jgi:hypothetical protein
LPFLLCVVPVSFSIIMTSLKLDWMDVGVVNFVAFLALPWIPVSKACVRSRWDKGEYYSMYIFSFRYVILYWRFISWDHIDGQYLVFTVPKLWRFWFSDVIYVVVFVILNIWKRNFKHYSHWVMYCKGKDCESRDRSNKMSLRDWYSRTRLYATRLYAKPAYLHIFTGSHCPLLHYSEPAYMQNPLIRKFLLAPELLHISGFYCNCMF